MDGIVIILAAFRPISAAIGSITLSRRRTIRGKQLVATVRRSYGLCLRARRRVARLGFGFGVEVAGC